MLHPDKSSSKEGLAEIKKMLKSEEGLDKEALSLFDLYGKISSEMDEALHGLMYRIDIPLSVVLSKMERKGIRLDLDHLWKVKQSWRERSMT